MLTFKKKFNTISKMFKNEQLVVRKNKMLIKYNYFMFHLFQDMSFLPR